MTFRRFLDVCEALWAEDLARIEPRLDLHSILERLRPEEKPKPPAAAARNTESLNMLLTQLPGGRMPG